MPQQQQWSVKPAGVVGGGEPRCGAGALGGRRSAATPDTDAALAAGWSPFNAHLLQDLSFTLCPSDRAQHLSLVLFRPAADAPGGHQYVAAGSLGLDPLLQMDSPSARHDVSVPVVDEVSKEAGSMPGRTLPPTSTALRRGSLSGEQVCAVSRSSLAAATCALCRWASMRAR